MYKEDLQRVFFLIHHNLVATSKVGFHSHNNLQMSFALSQEFAEMTQGLREIVIDATMAGMGRGARQHQHRTGDAVYEPPVQQRI